MMSEKKILDLLLEDEFVDRRNNRLLSIVRFLWEERKLTRSTLARALDISNVAVKNNVEKLLSHGIIEECEPEEASMGRPPSPLRLKKGIFYSFGMYIRRGWTRLVLVNAALDIVEERIYSENFENAEEAFDFFSSEIVQIRDRHGIENEKIMGCGVSVPGIVNQPSGIIINSPTFKKDRDFELRPEFGQGLGIDVFLMNDADLLALTENRLGNAVGMRNFLYLECVGYGLGMVLNGALYQGHQGGAGEVGYMQMSKEGKRNLDGRPGTLGRLAPFTHIPEIVSGIVSNGGETSAVKFAGDDGEISLDSVVKAAAEGDKLCVRLLSEFFETVGDALLNLAYLFNPETIFLDPWTADVPFVLEMLRRKMRSYGTHDLRLSTDIAPARYGMRDLPEGAALIPVIEYFKRST